MGNVVEITAEIAALARAQEKPLREDHERIKRLSLSSLSKLLFCLYFRRRDNRFLLRGYLAVMSVIPLGVGVKKSRLPSARAVIWRLSHRSAHPVRGLVLCGRLTKWIRSCRLSASITLLCSVGLRASRRRNSQSGTG